MKLIEDIKKAEEKAEKIINDLKSNKLNFNNVKQKSSKEKNLKKTLDTDKGKEKIPEKSDIEDKAGLILTIEGLANFCKKKGFVYPSGEIYGGFSGFWDFGVLGVELKNNLKQQWWKFHIQERDDIVGIDDLEDSC